MLIHSKSNQYLSSLYNQTTANTITYSFKDITLTNLEIKHVIFRANKKPPTHFLRLVYDNDPKANILPKYSDLRPLFILHDLENIDKPRIHTFEKNDLDSQLDEIVIIFLNTYVNNDDETIDLPLFIQPYVTDFGTNADFVMFIAKLYNINKSKPIIRKIQIDESRFEIFEKVSLLKKNIQTSNIVISFK
jgi:hypothetical protein